MNKHDFFKQYKKKLPSQYPQQKFKKLNVLVKKRKTLIIQNLKNNKTLQSPQK